MKSTHAISPMFALLVARNKKGRGRMGGSMHSVLASKSRASKALWLTTTPPYVGLEMGIYYHRLV